jgi:ABC-2 type transport system permease protein
MRMLADSGTGLGWVRWFSPLGWIEELRPLTSPRPVFLAPIAAFAVVCLALAVALAGRRDLGSSVLPDRAETRAHTALLSGPGGLAVRLTRGVAISWAISFGLTALVMGIIAKSVGDAFAADAGDRQTFARLGLAGSGARQYLAITFLLVALLVGLVAAGQIGHTRSEEAEGRLDNLLIRPISRRRWLAGRTVVASVYIMAAGLLAGSASWIGAASQHAGVSFPTLLAAGTNVVPPALLILGAGVVAFGLVPRAVSVVTYGILVWSFLVEIIGSVARASHWILDTSLFHQMTAAPARSPNWVTEGVIAGIAVAEVVLGVLAFERRDLVGE